MLFWILLNPIRYLNLRLNFVDRIFLLYFVFGVGITILGIVVFSDDNKLVVQTFTHYYLPSILYFIARAAFSRNSGLVVSKLSRMVILLALIWVINFFCEYYIVWSLKQPMFIPWVDIYLDRLKISSPDVDIKFNPLIVRTVLVGNPKIVGLLSAVLFVLLLPLFFSSSRNLKTRKIFLQ